MFIYLNLLWLYINNNIINTFLLDVDVGSGICGYYINLTNLLDGI